MTVMYSFCFWFSVRLGSIIVGLTCIVQSVAALVACSIGMDDLKRTSSQIDHWLQTNDLMMTKAFFTALRDDPKSYLEGFISALTVYLCSCIFMIWGAFKCNIYLLYPFMVIDFIRLVILSIVLVIVMLLIKTNTLSLAMVIGASTTGGFTLLYLWYQWFCTVALWQIIREIRRMEESNKRLQSSHQKKGCFDPKIALVSDYFSSQRYGGNQIRVAK